LLSNQLGSGFGTQPAIGSRLCLDLERTPFMQITFT
jgi:hypothetical protein